MAYTILIADDEQEIRSLLRLYLEKDGYQVLEAADGRSALSLLEKEEIDMALLDIMMPELDGFRVLKKLRETSNIPVMILSAKDQDADKILGLDLGADDYLTKPFEIVELLARVEAVLRRYNKTETLITVFDVVIDAASRSVTRDGDPISLTMKEFDLLLLLARNRNIALYRETIYETVWGGEYMGQSRTVDLHIQRLKKKLNWDNEIAAVYKVGYRLEGEEKRKDF